MEDSKLKTTVIAKSLSNPPPEQTVPMVLPNSQKEGFICIACGETGTNTLAHGTNCFCQFGNSN